MKSPILYALSLIILFYSCKPDNEELPKTKNEVLVDFSLVKKNK